MDHRRRFGLRAPRHIGDSTIVTPQLENYTLFANPFLDLKISESQSEGDKQVRRSPRIKKQEDEKQKLSKETSQADDSFGIVLNFATVNPDQFAINFGEGNEIEVNVEQAEVESEYGSLPFSRNCTYKYELPKGVDKESLVALWTMDDYFIILPKDQLKKDLLSKSIKGLEESSDQDDVLLAKATGSEDVSEPGTSKSEETKLKKSSNSEGSEETEPNKASNLDADVLVPEEIEEVFGKNSVIKVYPVTRMLRPGLDIFMLRKYMVDLESYISTIRKSIENASFVSQNSKTAERCIRFLAKSRADDLFEKANFQGELHRKRKQGDPSADSGYTSNERPDAPSGSCDRSPDDPSGSCDGSAEANSDEGSPGST